MGDDGRSDGRISFTLQIDKYKSLPALSPHLLFQIFRMMGMAKVGMGRVGTARVGVGRMGTVMVV